MGSLFPGLYFAATVEAVESRRRKHIDAPLTSRKENHSRRNKLRQGRVACNSPGTIATYPSIISQLSRLFLIPRCCSVALMPAAIDPRIYLAGQVTFRVY